MATPRPTLRQEGVIVAEMCADVIVECDVAVLLTRPLGKDRWKPLALSHLCARRRASICVAE
jgi:hypothetical protein